MARKRKPAADPDGIFRGVSAYFVPEGVQPRRLQVWKQKLVQMGGRVQKGKGAKGGRRSFNHVLAADAKALLRKLDAAWLHSFRGSTVSFQWLEESIQSGQRLPEHKFTINYEEEFKPKKAAAAGAGISCAPNLAKRSKMASDEDHRGTSGQDVKMEIPTEEHQLVPEMKVHRIPPRAASEEDRKGTSGKDVKKEVPTEEHHQDTSTHVHEGSAVKKEPNSGEPTTYAPPDVHSGCLPGLEMMF